MSSWETADMAAVLPTARPIISDAIEDAETANKVTAHGWVQKTAYDYDTYNKGTRELAEAVEAQASAAPVGDEEVTDAVGGIRPGDWSSNAAVYQWSDEFGEVGPAFPDLEKQLFGSENHVKTGLRYEK
jgi:ATP-dependent RNA helicase DDX3X